MRYYDIHITDPETRATMKHWSSLDQYGNPDPAALRIEFDVLIISGEAYGGSSLTVYGIPLTDLFDANNLYRKRIEVRGGMSKGLPLAKPSQAGPLFAGYVWESVANWIGTDMTLTLILNPTEHDIDSPGNFILNWKKGQTLAEALKQTFNVALPGTPQDIQISDRLVALSDMAMVAPTLGVLAEQIAKHTAAYYEGPTHPYGGVMIAIKHGEVTAWDGTQQAPPKQIDFEDLIGQPNWIGNYNLQFITTMRGDISIGNAVRMPSNMGSGPGFVTTQVQAYPSQHRYQSTFRGDFRIAQVRHVGDSRSDSGAQWCSVFIAVPQPSGGGS